MSKKMTTVSEAGQALRDAATAFRTAKDPEAREVARQAFMQADRDICELLCLPTPKYSAEWALPYVAADNSRTATEAPRAWMALPEDAPTNHGAGISKQLLALFDAGNVVTTSQAAAQLGVKVKQVTDACARLYKTGKCNRETEAGTNVVRYSALAAK